MSTDSTGARDEMSAAAGYGRPTDDASGMHGFGVAEVYGPDGELKQRVPFTNLITDVGEQMYGERGASLGSLPAPTGMQLGTGTTTPAKNGAGAAIVTYMTGSAQAFDGSFPASSKPATVRRIQYKVTWAAGTATTSGTPLGEVAIINQSVATNSGAASGATISRALLSPTVNKGASDTLAVTWNHDIGT